MLFRSVLSAFILLLGVLHATVSSQESERVPSGDLSDFFNPPGIKKTDSVSSTTRTIGSTTKKIDPKPDKKTPATDTPATKSPSTEIPATSTPATDANEPQPDPIPQPRSSDPAPKADSSTGDGRVKIETEELSAIEGGISFGRPVKTNWRVGVVMATGSNPARNVICRIPVPVQWPEQTVSVYEENIPAEISDVSWEDLGNIRLMKFRIGSVAPGEKLIATVTFSVSTSQINAPKNTSIFRVPKKRTRDIKPYFGESPEISIRNTKMKKQAKQLFETSQSDWKKVEGIFDWVRENIEERAGKPKGSVATFLAKSGTGEDRVSLFVAMCRINKVPARMVFVDGSQYAEFYMVDDKEQGHWFPCQVTGIREFGSIGEPRVILQKGDNYRVPGEKKKLKFVPAKAQWQGEKKFKIGFSREPLSVK